MPDAVSQTLAGETFARLLECFAPLSPKIALAISGGPDSMCLAFCAARWGQADFIALIVDHGLRPESADEAAQVKTRLEKIGLQAEILRWDHAPIAGRLHEKARAARYRLLLDACARHGASDLLLAHHRDDQAETIVMRLMKGSGPEGLAGIAAESMRGDIRILRPFLSLPKQTLIATCDAAQIPFVADPSNESDKFARSRLRKIMPLLAEEGMTTDHLVALGIRMKESADALDHYTRLLLQDSVTRDNGGALRIDRAKWRDIPRAIAMRALSACLRYVHDGDYPPDHASLGTLLDAMTAATPAAARSLHGCLVSMTATQGLILREPSAATENLPINPGETLVWDRRWLVSLDRTEAEPGTIRALGTPPHGTLDRLAPGLRRHMPQGRARATLPALWRGDALLAIPSFDAGAAFRLRLRKQSFP